MTVYAPVRQPVSTTKRTILVIIAWVWGICVSFRSSWFVLLSPTTTDFLFQNLLTTKVMLIAMSTSQVALPESQI